MASLARISSWAPVISVRSWKAPAGPLKVPTAMRSSSWRSFSQVSWQAFSVTRASRRASQQSRRWARLDSSVSW
jgi:hypothetical protein